MDDHDDAKIIELLCLDVDGVMTDGSILLDDAGRETKRFHVRDGTGLRAWMELGNEVAIITGRRSEVVAARMASLGVEHLYQGRDDKLPCFEELLARLGVPAEESAYMGDDLVDLPVMRRAGFALAVADAHDLVREHAHWISPSPGGRGAAREACEFILAAQDRLPAAYRRFL